MKAWTQSFSGKVVTPADLQADQVSLADIAHTLSQKVRFNGHLRELGFSVAQHCVMGAGQISGPFALAFLLHEVSEVYLPDIPSPLKALLRVNLAVGEGQVTWVDLENQHAKVIFEALDLTSVLPLISSKEVKKMDLQMLMTEKRDLMGPEPESWGIDVEPLDIRINEVWTAKRAKEAFQAMYVELLSAHPFTIR